MSIPGKDSEILPVFWSPGDTGSPSGLVMQPFLLPAWVLLAQWQITRALRLGYAYDISRNSLTDFVNGSHEFMLGFDFHFSKKDIVSPRYF